MNPIQQDRFAPINVGKVLPPPDRVPMALATVQSCFTPFEIEAMNDKIDALSELSFAELLELHNEASEDSSWDTFNDVSRELKYRRDEAKDELEKLFTASCANDTPIPMTSAGKVISWTLRQYLAEAMNTADGIDFAARLLLSPSDRSGIVAALAREYVEQQTEDLLKAGW